MPAPSPAATRMARRFRHAFLSGIQCVRNGAPGLSIFTPATSQIQTDVGSGPKVNEATSQIRTDVDRILRCWLVVGSGPKVSEATSRTLTDSGSGPLVNNATPRIQTNVGSGPTVSSFVNPLDIIYEIVAELSCSHKARENGG